MHMRCCLLKYEGQRNADAAERTGVGGRGDSSIGANSTQQQGRTCSTPRGDTLTLSERKSAYISKLEQQRRAQGLGVKRACSMIGASSTRL